VVSLSPEKAHWNLQPGSSQPVHHRQHRRS
jgi:hypothetical protein